jgi:phosphoserine phosphatase
MASSVLLVTVTGKDQPGVTTAFTQAFAASGAVLIDVGRSVLHNILVLAFMVRVESGLPLRRVRYAVGRTARETKVVARTRLVSDEALNRWMVRQHRQRSIVTLLGPRITAAQMAAVTGRLQSSGVRIEVIERLSARQPGGDQLDSRMCLQMVVSGEEVTGSDLRSALLSVAVREGLDLAVQADSIFCANRRLIAFDMDSTLIEMEVIDELARLAGVGKEVAAITELAMTGHLDFEASLRKRVSLLKGLPAWMLAEIAQHLPVTRGAPRLLRTLKSLGYKTAILSGGFACFARALQKEFGFDYIGANELEIQNGSLTGRVSGRIVSGTTKAQLLREIAEQEGISMEQTVAVGDGANDIPMLTAAGLGIAFRAKPLVRTSTQTSISKMGLDAILYVIGLRDRHIEASGICPSVEPPDIQELSISALDTPAEVLSSPT